MNEPNPFAIFLLCVAGAAALIFLLWLNHQWVTRHDEKPQRRGSAAGYVVSYILGGAGPVNRFEESSQAVMSRAEEEGIDDRPSSLGTDAGRTRDGQDARKIRGEELLTLCQLMRRYNIPRDEATAAFKSSGLPFNNGVWSQAAPPVDEPQDVTPIAGRPTKAPFREVDPALAYRPLE